MARQKLALLVLAAALMAQGGCLEIFRNNRTPGPQPDYPAKPTPLTALAPPRDEPKAPSSIQDTDLAIMPPANRTVDRTDGDWPFTRPSQPPAKSAASISPEPTAPSDSRPPTSAPPRQPTVKLRPFSERINPSLPGAILYQEAMVARQPTDMRALFELRLLYLLAGQSEKALADPPRVLAPEAEPMLAMLRSAQVFRDQLGAGVDRAAATTALSQLEELRATLRAAADLTIPTVKLCRDVAGFGVYDEMPAEEFVGFRPRKVLVYCELANFLAAKKADGKYHTLLNLAVELYDANGKLIQQWQDKSVADASLNRREDFFLRWRISLPGAGPGKYTLKVIVEDINANKTASYPLSLRFKAPS